MNDEYKNIIFHSNARYFCYGNFFMSSANAEIKTYEGVGEYIMGDFEKEGVAKLRAKARAVQNAKDKAGIFLQSYTKTVNARLTNDEIIAVTNTFATEVDVKYEVVSVDVFGTPGIMYRATVTLKIDTDGISYWLSLPDEVRHLLLNLTEEAQAAADENNRKIMDLKTQLANTINERDREKIRSEIENINNAFLSNLIMDEGTQLMMTDIQTAIEKYNAAIKLNPNNSFAYNNRALAYYYSNNFEAALTDYANAIQIDPKLVQAYVNRGLIYMSLQNYNQAISEFNAAININPNYIEPYNNRGVAYYWLKNY